jgi:transcriptional regulator with XRE-family HTH domain
MPAANRFSGLDPLDTFHGRLRAARTHARLTEEEAAGLGQLTVKKLQGMERGSESGKQPNMPALTRLGAAYGVSAVWLAAGGAAGAKLVPEWYVPGRAG